MKKTISVIITLLICYLLHAQDSSKNFLSQENLKLYPLLWQQSAAEYRALCYQAFNVAALRLNEVLKNNPHKKNLAIITDLDESILDNSNIETQKIKTGKEITYNEWLQWLNKPGLPTVPGGVDFLQYAAGKGVTIFYISNRNIKGLQITLAVLQKLNLPYADTNHILLMTNTLSKESRRQTVIKDYNVVLLLGDNLNDFTDVFEGKSIDERFAETDKIKEDWGKTFIVLPNAVYGEWQNALYNYQDSFSSEEKITMLKGLLKGFGEIKH